MEHVGAASLESPERQHGAMPTASHLSLLAQRTDRPSNSALSQTGFVQRILEPLIAEVGKAPVCWSRGVVRFTAHQTAHLAMIAPISLAEDSPATRSLVGLVQDSGCSAAVWFRVGESCFSKDKQGEVSTSQYKREDRREEASGTL